jgi:hypothetical protein
VSDNITLHRAAEQARSALSGWANHGLWAWPESALQTCKQNTEEALVALDAALAEPPAKPEPATDEQIVKAGGECAVVDNEYLLDFRDGFRAAERFHGIRKGDKT